MTKRQHNYSINPMEDWKEISEYENYQISNLGNVRRLLKSGKYKPVKRRKDQGYEYARVNLFKKGANTTKGVMLLVFTHFIYPRLTEKEKKGEKRSKNGATVFSIDGKLSNCAENNIKWAWKSEDCWDELPEKEQKWVKKSKYVSFVQLNGWYWYFKFLKKGGKQSTTDTMIIMTLIV